MSIAIPSFQDTIRSSRLTAAANALVTSFNLARSEAIKRQQQVVVSQTGAGWQNGWQIFVDIPPLAIAGAFADDGDTILCEATEDCLLRAYEPLRPSFILTGNNNFVNFVRYQPDGTISNVVGGSFVVCDNSDSNDIPEANTSRLIIVSGTGRIRMGVDVDHNGIPEKDGVELSSCTGF
ncbi:MAG: GspH/FimT family protein [Methylovulum sp.]|nr:GspH/FimT family protein [Methylovulum sp.]